MRRSAGLVVAVLSGVLLTLHAQSSAPTQQSRPPVFQAGIDVVQMDVTVLDKKGQPVRGLTASDFTVVVDGVDQPIVDFEAVDLPDVDTTAAAWTRDAALDVSTNDRKLRRIVVIVMDDAHLGKSVEGAKRIGRDIVARLGPDDLAAVTFTDSGRRQDITYDHQRLLAAIESTLPHMSGAAGRASSARAREPISSLSCAYRGPSRSFNACVVDTFVTAANALLDAPAGRKTFIWIGTDPGGTVFSVPDIASMAMAPPEHPTQMFEEILALYDTLANLQRANVDVYAINTAPVPGLPGDWQRIFAEDTGGRAFPASNTPWIYVPQVFREISAYYMIGFRPTRLYRDGRFQKVRVKVNRPDVEVRTREGYFAPVDRAGRMSVPAPPPIERAVNGAVPGGDLPLAMTLVPIAVPDEKNASVAIATLVREPIGDEARTFEILARALDSDCGDCRKLPSARQAVSFAPRAGQSDARSEILSALRLPPGSYEIRVAAASNGRVGSVIAHVDVPQFEKAALSASGLAIAATQSVATADREVVSGLLPIVPTAAREFAPSSVITAFLRLYQLGAKVAAPVSVTTTVLDVRGGTRFSDTRAIGASAFGAGKSADYRIDVPLVGLEPGAYLLAVAATGTAASRRGQPLAIRRESRFWVK